MSNPGFIVSPRNKPHLIYTYQHRNMSQQSVGDFNQIVIADTSCIMSPATTAAEVQSQWALPEPGTWDTMSQQFTSYSNQSTPGGFASAYWAGASIYNGSEPEHARLALQVMDDPYQPSVRHSAIEAPEASHQVGYFGE